MKCLKSKTIFEQNLMEGKKSKVLSIKDLRNQLPRARNSLTINNLQKLDKTKISDILFLCKTK